MLSKLPVICVPVMSRVISKVEKKGNIYPQAQYARSSLAPSWVRFLFLARKVSLESQIHTKKKEHRLLNVSWTPSWWKIDSAADVLPKPPVPRMAETSLWEKRTRTDHPYTNLPLPPQTFFLPSSFIPTPEHHQETASDPYTPQASACLTIDQGSTISSCQGST